MSHPQSERKLTPLHIACKAGADGATMLLIDNGADVTARDVSARRASPSA